MLSVNQEGYKKKTTHKFCTMHIQDQGYTLYGELMEMQHKSSVGKSCIQYVILVAMLKKCHHAALCIV